MPPVPRAGTHLRFSSDMSIQRFLEANPANRSQAAPIDLAAAGDAARDVQREEAEKQDPALQQDRQEDGEGHFDLADFPVDKNLKAFVWVHAGWRRHRNGSCALCPVCEARVRCAGNTTNLDNHTRRNHREEYDQQQIQKGALSKGQGAVTSKLSFG